MHSKAFSCDVSVSRISANLLLRSTGALALLAAAKPGADSSQLKAAILAGVDPIAELHGKTITGVCSLPRYLASAVQADVQAANVRSDAEGRPLHTLRSLERLLSCSSWYEHKLVTSITCNVYHLHRSM